MKVLIVHDSKHGNGKIIAEQFRSIFQSNEIKFGHIKDISPKDVLKFEPDVIIVGGAVRIFRLTGSRKWMKKVNKELSIHNKSISFGMCFVTHLRDQFKIRSKSDQLQAILKEKQIENVFPEYLLCQVIDVEGPFKEGVLERSQTFGKQFLNWVMNSEVVAK